MSETKTRKRSKSEPDAAIQPHGDFGYLADKTPTDRHRRMAAWLEREYGLVVPVKHVQIVLATLVAYQRSADNRQNSRWVRQPAAEPVQVTAKPKKADKADKAKAPGKAKASKPSARKAA